tara:strand:+ start:1188 stop:1757 length:570 start_codon:yes stop_codon:yes gene_type:complete
MMCKSCLSFLKVIMKKIITIACLIMMGMIGCVPSTPIYSVESFHCYPESVYLFRHAEKQIIKGEKDPELTIDGFKRSNALAEALKDVQNGVVYSSEFKRTQQTVNPLASVWNTNVNIHTAHDPEGQIKRALSHCVKTVIISGHSNTIPNLIRLFGITDEITISDDQYGDLFQIEWQDGKPILTITQVGQ